MAASPDLLAVRLSRVGGLVARIGAGREGQHRSMLREGAGREGQDRSAERECGGGAQALGVLASGMRGRNKT